MEMWQKNLQCIKHFNFGDAQKFFEEHGSTQQQHSRGYKFFVEGFIHDVCINESEPSVKAKCFHSQKRNEKPHNLVLEFRKENDFLNLKECHCSCEVGLSQSCHHVIGLGFYLQDKILRGDSEIPESLSCTSKPIEWNKPRGSKIAPESVLQTIFQKPTNINRKKRPVCPNLFSPKTAFAGKEVSGETKIKILKSKLKKINENIPFSYILNLDNRDESMTTLGMQKLNAMEDDIVPINLPNMDIECINILISKPLPRKDSFFLFTMEDSSSIQERTKLQSNCNEWHMLRRERFTSSCFGNLCKRQKAIDLDYFNKLWEIRDLSNVNAIQHGKTHEEHGKNVYKTITKHDVFDCGLVIHPYAPYLGASPDGIIKDKNGQFGILEIKCPYSKKYNTLKEALKSKTFFLQEDENKKLCLKENDNYFYQVQGCMLITGLKWCDLCVYLKESNECHIIRVEFNELFCINMYDKLTDLYNIYLNF